MSEEDREQYNAYLMQKDLQETSQSGDTLKYAPQIQERVQENQAILVEQVNPKKVVKDVVLSLMNVEEDEMGKLVKMGEPLMNQLGINRMRFILRGVLNQSTTLSNLDKEDVSKLTVQLANDITDDLTLNWKQYGINDKIFLDEVVDIMSFNCYFALKRALGMNEKNWLGRISVENITNSTKPVTPRPKSFLDNFRL